MVIRRDAYVDVLLSRRGNGMIKVVTGMRRSGKSFLLFRLFRDRLLEEGVGQDQILSINLENRENAPLRDPDGLYRHLASALAGMKRPGYVLLDEVQYAIRSEDVKRKDRPLPLYDVLNSLRAMEGVDVYVTGSNSRFLSSDVMTEFRGRGDAMTVFPLSFAEFCSGRGVPVRDAWEEYLYYGGLPQVLQESGDAAKARYLQGLFSEIYFKDIKERYGLRNDSGMEELVRVIASSVGSLTNPHRLANTFASSGRRGVSEQVLADHLQFLQDSFIIRKAERYDIKGRKYIGTPSKYYFSDVGLRNALLNFRQVERSHIMENIIFNELVRRGYGVDVGVVPLNEMREGRHVKTQLEVDFVANMGGRRYYVQSALSLEDGDTLHREQRSLDAIPDSFKKIIVTQGSALPWHAENGSLIIGIERFLLDERSLDL